MGDSWITQNLQAVIADLTDECSGSGITVNAAEGYKWRVELMYRHLLAKECLNGGLPCGETTALDYLVKAYRELCHYVDNLLVHPKKTIPSQQAQVLLIGADPSLEFLEYLIESRF